MRAAVFGEHDGVNIDVLVLEKLRSESDFSSSSAFSDIWKVQNSTHQDSITTALSTIISKIEQPSTFSPCPHHIKQRSAVRTFADHHRLPFATGGF